MSLIAKHLSTRVLAQARFECAAFAFYTPSRWSSNDAGGPNASGAASYLPQWLKNALPSALGGDKETLRELESLTLDSYLRQITAARKLGSISGSAFGAKASDPGTQGFFRSTELVIGALTPEEKQSESLTGDRVTMLARELDLSVEQINAVMGRYHYTKHMMAVLAQRKREGKELPKTVEEVEQLTGNWRSFVAGSPSNTPMQGGHGFVIPSGAVHPKGGQCGLAGMRVGRSTKCPRFRKSYKACCGKGRP